MIWRYHSFTTSQVFETSKLIQFHITTIKMWQINLSLERCDWCSQHTCKTRVGVRLFCLDIGQHVHMHHNGVQTVVRRYSVKRSVCILMTSGWWTSASKTTSSQALASKDKFVTVKAVLFFSFWQSCLFQFFTSLDLFSRDTGNVVLNLIITVEMVFAAIA